MRKITVYDRIEEIFMEADAETFRNLEERIATIKRLRKMDRKPAKLKTPEEVSADEAKRMMGNPIPLLDVDVRGRQ
jgi:hypothetical protein